MSRASLGVLLLSLALVAALCTAALAVSDHRSLASERAQELAAERALSSFQMRVTALEDLARESMFTYGDATDLPAVDGGAFRGEGRAWLQIHDVVQSLDRELDARIAIYEEPDDDDATELVLLGYADGAKVHRDVPGDWPGRIPATITRRILQQIESGEAPPYCWFSREADGPVRLNIVIPDIQEYEPPEDDEEGELIVVPRAFHTSLAWTPHEGQRVTAYLDVVDGRLAPELPGMELAGENPPAKADITDTGVEPPNWAMEWPVRSEAPRLAWAEQAPDASLLIPILGSLALLLAAAGLILGLRGRGKEPAGVPPDVTAEAAHEMRTPLTAMRGEIEVTLRRERTTEEYRGALESALDEVKGLQGILNNVLLLTRGAFTAPATEPVDLAAVVQAEVERVAAANPEREVTIDRDDGALMVTGDPSLLARAVGNLLDNAALHSTAGGPIKTVLAREGRSAVLTVTDDGPGIPRARHEKIFQRFYRGPEVGQRAIPGSGLGLPISRWIAEIHGGSLGIDPALIASTRFAMRIPVA